MNYKPEINEQVMEDLDSIFDQYSPIDPIDQKYQDERSIIQTFLFITTKHNFIKYKSIFQPIYVADLHEIYQTLTKQQQNTVYKEMQAIIPENKRRILGTEIAKIFLDHTENYTKQKTFARAFAQGYNLSITMRMIKDL